MEVFRVFLRLGLTSFGGPVAHLGYFRLELVQRRAWLDEEELADLVALCQFLPGPSSSQVAICAGTVRAGALGGLAAWLGFSLPSALLMMAFAYGTRLANLSQAPWIHGMKVVAVAVVAQAVWSMARRLCPDLPRAALALVSAAFCLSIPSAAGQIAAILLGGLVGWRFLASSRESARASAPLSISRRSARLALVVFLALLVISVFASSHVLAAFYRTGSLVFGGGHVVLPLLQQAICAPGWVSTDSFLAGYGLAQAMPGPLFSLAAYLGASMQGWPSPWLGGLLCLVAIYLPSFLLLLGVLPHWERLRKRTGVQSALRGINAAVVGLLLAAFFSPVWSSGIQGPRDILVAVVAGLALERGVPAWMVVLAGALLGQ